MCVHVNIMLLPNMGIGISTKIPVLAWMRALGVLRGLQLILLRISH